MRTIIKSYQSSSIHQGLEYNLTGKLLLATPFIEDNSFSQAVIYICGHDPKGTVGLIINKAVPNLSFANLLNQLHLDVDGAENLDNLKIHYGGPIEITRGFVLHSINYMTRSSIAITKEIALTSTIEILKLLAQGKGPRDYIICLGYTGWTANQIEKEIQENDWLIIDGQESIIFGSATSEKWLTSMQTIGVNPAMLSLEIGRA